MELDWSYHFVYLLLHLKKHFLNSGVGIRQFMDLSVVVEKCRLDWQQISGWLHELGLCEFAQKCLLLCERWFGTQNPLGGNSDESFLKYATEKVLKNGVFGFDAEENADNKLLLQYNEDGSASNMHQKLFPGYESMVCIPYYSFLKNRK